MANCGENDIRTLEQTRNFLQIPAFDGRCGTQVIYYGGDCQFMQLTGAQRNVRNASSPLRSWNRRTRTFCNIGNSIAPPDIPSGTLEFYEGCGAGIPLPHILGDCDIWAVVNHGLCRSEGDICDFEDYAEVYRLNVLNEARNRRTSYDGNADPLTNTLNVEFLDVLDVTKIDFVDVLAEEAAAGNISTASIATKAEFACESGCGQTVCGCSESCNDGTQIFYIGIGSTADVSQVAWSVDGATVQLSDLPQDVAGFQGAVAVRIFNGRLYVLAYNNPARFMSTDIDENGNISGVWDVINEYDVADFGALRELQVCGNGDTMVVLGSAGAYLFGAGEDGLTEYLDDPTDTLSDVDCCGNTVVVVGEGSQIYRSTDGGRNYAVVPAPEAADFRSVTVESSNTFWVGTGGGTGNVWRTTDAGTTWIQIQPQNDTTLVGIRAIDFVDSNIGWIIDQTNSRLYSTWLGGLSEDVWCNGSNRIGDFPAGFTIARGVALPDCSSSWLRSNSLMVLGRDNGLASALIGKPQISFG